MPKKKTFNFAKMSKLDIVDLYRQNNFNKHATSRALNITYRNLCIRLQKDNELNEMFKSAEVERIDIAESALLKQIKKGNTTAIIFFLKTKGKGRGYVERTEILQTGDEGIELLKKIAQEN